jgi:hypothetical protein
MNKAVHASVEELKGALIVYEGTTTLDGNAGWISLFDAAMIPVFGSDAAAIIGKTAKINSGAAYGETQVVTGYDTVTGEVSFAAMSTQILRGTSWMLLVG